MVWKFQLIFNFYGIRFVGELGVFDLFWFMLKLLNATSSQISPVSSTIFILLWHTERWNQKGALEFMQFFNTATSNLVCCNRY